jgi:hypothetical protein
VPVTEVVGKTFAPTSRRGGLESSTSDLSQGAAEATCAEGFMSSLNASMVTVGWK